MKVYVHTAFILQRADQTKIPYDVGEYDMTEEDFNHSYTKQFITPVEVIVEEKALQEDDKTPVKSVKKVKE